MNGPGNRPPRQDMGWRLAVTFAAAAILYLAPLPQSMALNILDLATSLADRGSVGLDEFSAVDVAVREGRTLSGMPPGASLIAAAIYLVGRPLFWLAPEETGFLVKRGEILGLAEAIRSLLHKPEQGRALGQHGRRVAEVRFSPERHLEDFLSVAGGVVTRWAR